jgi:hypothetical protein
MAGTFVTKEPVDTGTSEDDLKREITLRVKAGCIRCWVDRQGGQRTLCTEWNVIGENASPPA